MPKIKIDELDNTRAVASSASDNIVYVPGELGTGSTMTIDKPELFTSASAFKKAVGFDSEKMAHVYAYNLLLRGLYVLYGPVSVTTSEGTESVTYHWEKLEDKSKYDIRFITAGGRTSVSMTTMITTASNRGDCIALLDDAKAVTDTASLMNDIAGTNSTYAASFAPWVSMKVDDGTGSSSEMDMPASFAYLCAYSEAIRSNPMWYAVAGVSRGQIPGLVHPLAEFGDKESDTLQSRAAVLDGDGDNTGLAINPICYVKPYGYVIWGNRTLVNNNGALKASSFLNIRLLVSEIKKALYKASRRVTFEQNNDILWVNFKAEIEPLLDKMVSGNGIAGYRMIKEKTSAKARLKARIKIVPIEAVEDFELTVELADSLDGTSVTENVA